MILDERDELRRRQIERVMAAAVFLPLVALALIDKAPLERRDEFLGRAFVIGVVSFVVAGRGDVGSVVKIVVPDRIEAIASFGQRANQAGFLPLVFIHDQDRPLAGGGPRFLAD